MRSKADKLPKLYAEEDEEQEDFETEVDQLELDG